MYAGTIITSTSKYPIIAVRHLRPVPAAPKHRATELCVLYSKTPTPPGALGVVVEPCCLIGNGLRTHVSVTASAAGASNVRNAAVQEGWVVGHT
jgi:hypothetical protein